MIASNSLVRSRADVDGGDGVVLAGRELDDGVEERVIHVAQVGDKVAQHRLHQIVHILFVLKGELESWGGH